MKLALGNISVFFDIIFITQHYWLYQGNGLPESQEGRDVDGEADPLLRDGYRVERD